MDNRLIFRGYATHDLEIAEIKFRARYNKEPEFFAIQPSWDIVGSERNKSKVVVSTLAGYAGVFIPLALTMAEFEQIEAERAEKKSLAPARQPTAAPETTDEFSDEIVFKTYCSYCGCLFVPTKPKETYCSSPICAERHKEYLEYYERMKALAGEAQNNHKPTPIEKAKSTSDDFELDDPTRKMLQGFVYFIEAENGLVKIGRSDDISRRFADLVFMSPVRLYLRHAIKASNYVRAERHLHNQFSMKRDHGEWFRLSEDELEWVKGLRNYALDMA